TLSPSIFLFSFLLIIFYCLFLPFFFFNATATSKIYTLSLHDALPIYAAGVRDAPSSVRTDVGADDVHRPVRPSVRAARLCRSPRSEEHTSELQSRGHLVCRLLLEKKNKKHDGS